MYIYTCSLKILHVFSVSLQKKFRRVRQLDSDEEDEDDESVTGASVTGASVKGEEVAASRQNREMEDLSHEVGHHGNNITLNVKR